MFEWTGEARKEKEILVQNIANSYGLKCLVYSGHIGIYSVITMTKNSPRFKYLGQILTTDLKDMSESEIDAKLFKLAMQEWKL